MTGLSDDFMEGDHDEGKPSALVIAADHPHRDAIVILDRAARCAESNARHGGNSEQIKAEAKRLAERLRGAVQVLDASNERRQ